MIMKLEERLNRIEVNQMVILSELKELKKRLPKVKTEIFEDAKVPRVDRENWSEYLHKLREQYLVHNYAMKIVNIADDLEQLAENVKGTDENKTHFKELLETCNGMSDHYMKFNPLRPGGKLGKWYAKFREKKNVTTPYDVFLKNG
jgi:hypothetical protein